MPNSWFQFKQVTIHQDKCAMKIGTDSILLGAWADTENTSSILDIGAGTGILSITLAQKTTNTNITGIEIDEDSVLQAQQNVINSPWSDRIKIIKCSLQEFKSVSGKFDLIISNPPFFQNSLNTPDINRTKARHNITLTQEELALATINNLSASGRLIVIWPIIEGEIFIELIKNMGLFVNKLTYVKPNADKPSHRLLIEFSFQNKNIKESEIVIEGNIRHQYTDEYKNLTKDFYLNFR